MTWRSNLAYRMRNWAGACTRQQAGRPAQRPCYEGVQLLTNRSSLIRAGAAGAVALGAAAAFAVPASASVTPAPAAVHMGAAVAAAKPNTDLKGSPAKWSPAKLTAPPTKGTCSKTNYSFTVTNDTTKSQTLQYKSGTTKKTLGVLKAKEKGGICAVGSKGAKSDLYVKGSSSVLTVTLS
jgi:hypothetical protein